MIGRVILATTAFLTVSALPLPAQQWFPNRAPASDERPADSQAAEAAVSPQEAPEDSQREQYYRLALDEFMVLVPLRDREVIRNDVQRSQEDEQRAREEKRNAEDLERLARDQLEAQKSEIDAIKARLKVAKGEDREADVVVLESDKKLAEGAKELLEKRRDMRRKEIKAWDTAAKLAASTRKAAELELELANARETLRERLPQGRGEELRRLELRINELEKRTLEAQKDRAELRAKVAQSERDIVNSRLELHKTRSKIGSG